MIEFEEFKYKRTVKLYPEEYFRKNHEYSGGSFYFKGDAHGHFDIVPEMVKLLGSAVEIDEANTTSDENGYWVIDDWMIEKELNPQDNPEYFI